jgi:hypothetical protein
MDTSATDGCTSDVGMEGNTSHHHQLKGRSLCSSSALESRKAEESHRIVQGGAPDELDVEADVGGGGVNQKRKAVNTSSRGDGKLKRKRAVKIGKASQKEWNVADKPTSTAGLEASEALSNLSQGAISNLAHTTSQEWIQSMKVMVEGLQWKGEIALAVNSIRSLVMRCKRSLAIAAGVEFVTMVNMLQLAAKADR